MSDNPYDKAREILREHGRTQGVYHDIDTGRYCLVGALAAARGINPLLSSSQEMPFKHDLYPPLAAVVREQFPGVVLGDNEGALSSWNDRDASDEDVDLVLDKAARRWDETA